MDTTSPSETAAGARPARVFFPCFDGYRALAAGAVLLLHVGVASGYAFRAPRRRQVRLPARRRRRRLLPDLGVPALPPVRRRARGRRRSRSAPGRLLPGPVPPHLPCVLGRADRRRAVPARADAPDPRHLGLPLVLPAAPAVQRRPPLRRHPAGVDALRRGQLLRVPPAVGARHPRASRGAPPTGSRWSWAGSRCSTSPASSGAACSPTSTLARQPRPARAPRVLRRVRARHGARGRERMGGAARPDLAAARARRAGIRGRAGSSPRPASGPPRPSSTSRPTTTSSPPASGSRGRSRTGCPRSSCCSRGSSDRRTRA